MIIIKNTTFGEIFPLWRYGLWPGRKSEIKPTNGIKFMGGYDKEIEKNIPTFFGAFIGDECVGVNTGFATGKSSYRSRGLYVVPKHREEGIAHKLLHATQEQCIIEGYELIWSMPRKESLLVYLTFGFKKVSKFFEENVEFGPNCFVSKILID